MHISKSLQKKLPFKLKPKLMKKRASSTSTSALLRSLSHLHMTVYISYAELGLLERVVCDCEEDEGLVAAHRHGG